MSLSFRLTVLLVVAVGVASPQENDSAAFPLPTTNSGPNQITAGPDGALWFTESFASQIGRITTSGVVTEYPTPTPSSNPSGITVGPDGAIWFTESSVFTAKSDGSLRLACLLNTRCPALTTHSHRRSSQEPTAPYGSLRMVLSAASPRQA
jgi:hypothetical protein